MARKSSQPLVTSDLNQEFDAHTQALLRQRFIWFAGTMSVFDSLVLLVMLLAGVAGLLGGPEVYGSFGPLTERLRPSWQLVVAWTFLTTLVVAYVSCFIGAKRGVIQPDRMLRATYLLVMVDGLLQVTGAWAGAPGTPGLFAVMVVHIVACSLLPWTPLQALKPILPPLAVDALLTIVLRKDGDSIGSRLFVVLLSQVIMAPGIVICWVRHSARMSEFKLEFFQKRYGQVRRELFDARKIHESLFPEPIKDGSVQFAYLYEPMHQIGGDYLYAAGGGEGKPVSIVLMDVTGHGIPAALTVNRLHGELERVFAERPDIGPGDVLSLLNRYVYLTLADHSVFVTALCLKADPTKDTLEYASGGHPTAYLRGVNGTVHELPSTTMLLGVSPTEDYPTDAATLPFLPGDSVIAYTDGATEARNAQGRMLGLKGMQAMVAGLRNTKQGGWPLAVGRVVEEHRQGPPEDDTLVIEVYRPIPAEGGGRGAGEAAVTTSRPQPV